MCDCRVSVSLPVRSVEHFLVFTRQLQLTPVSDRCAHEVESTHGFGIIDVDEWRMVVAVPLCGGGWEKRGRRGGRREGQGVGMNEWANEQ